MPCPSCGDEIAIPGSPPADDSITSGSAADFGPPLTFSSEVAGEKDWVARLPDGRMFGPGTLEQLRALVTAGRLPRGVEVKRQHESHWRPLDGAAPTPLASPPYSAPAPAAVPAAPAARIKPPRTPLRPGELTLFWKIWYGVWMTLFGLGGVVSLIATLIAAIAHPLGAIISGMGTLFSFLGIWLLYSTFYSSGPFARDPHESPRQNMSGYHLVRYGCMLMGVFFGSAGLGQLLTIAWVAIALFIVSRHVEREKQLEHEKAQAAAAANNDPKVAVNAAGPEGARPAGPAGDSGQPPAAGKAPIDPSPYLNTQLTSEPVLLGRPDWVIINPHGHFIAVQQPGNHETQVIDLRDGKVVRKFATQLGDQPVAISREGDRLFTGIGQHHIWDGPNAKHPVTCDRYVSQSLLRFDSAGFGYVNRKALVFADLAAGNRLAELTEFSDVVTRGGAYVVRPTPGRLTFYEMSTGKRTADVSVPRLKDTLPLISLSRDGRYAAISQTSLESYLLTPTQRSTVTQSQLCVWDLANGRERATFIVPTGRNKPRWLGNRYLLCDNVLIDIDARRAIGKYNLTHASHEIDDRLWVDTREEFRWLKPVSLVDPQEVARVQSDPNSAGRRLAGPGDGVTSTFNGRRLRRPKSELKSSPTARTRSRGRGFKSAAANRARCRSSSTIFRPAARTCSTAK